MVAKLKQVVLSAEGVLCTLTGNLLNMVTILEDGHVYSFDLKSCFQATLIPKFETLKGVNVKQVCCGAQHWLFLDSIAFYV